MGLPVVPLVKYIWYGCDIGANSGNQMSLDEDNDIRSSIGLAVDWLTVVGPMNFSLAQPISKNSGDITETFRFNLGTTF